MIYQKFLIYFLIFKYFILKIVKIGEIKMKERTKEFLQKYLIGFILGVISAGLIIVYAETYFPSNQTTYDNTNTELQSKNVQDAIDELYGVCFPSAADQIIEAAGLEKDSYECRYFFTGANPNNYITFNGEEAGWRIISVECDGTIKIMRIASIGTQKWDTENGSSWDRPTSLNTYLNETYYNELNNTAKSQIVVKNWNIGATTYDNNDLAEQINNENSKKWNGKVALPTASEYLRVNNNINQCKTSNMYNNNVDICKTTNWIYNNILSNSNLLLLSPCLKSNSHNNNLAVIAKINPAGNAGLILSIEAYNNGSISPTLYISSDVTLTGSGTQSDPYVVNS